MLQLPEASLKQREAELRLAELQALSVGILLGTSEQPCMSVSTWAYTNIYTQYVCVYVYVKINKYTYICTHIHTYLYFVLCIICHIVYCMLYAIHFTLGVLHAVNYISHII